MLRAELARRGSGARPASAPSSSSGNASEPRTAPAPARGGRTRRPAGSASTAAQPVEASLPPPLWPTPRSRHRQQPSPRPRRESARPAARPRRRRPSARRPSRHPPPSPPRGHGVPPRPRPYRGRSGQGSRQGTAKAPAKAAAKAPAKAAAAAPAEAAATADKPAAVKRTRTKAATTEAAPAPTAEASPDAAPPPPSRAAAPPRRRQMRVKADLPPVHGTAGRLRTRGHPAACAAIRRYIDTERAPHAILLSGPRGSGKTTLALDLASGLLCLADDPTQRPCHACPACHKVEHGNHPDLHRIAPEGAGEQIRLAQVQALVSELALLPMEGRVRVALVESANRLNPDAQNAFLKTLEEPTGAACLVLCADETAPLLPTVISRTARHRLGWVPPADHRRAAGRAWSGRRVPGSGAGVGGKRAARPGGDPRFPAGGAPRAGPAGSPAARPAVGRPAHSPGRGARPDERGGCPRRGVSGRRRWRWQRARGCRRAAAR